MQRPSREKLEAMEREGWRWDDAKSTLVKDSPASTVEPEYKISPYKPAFNDNAINPIEQEKASRGSEILSKLHDIDRTIAKAETKKAQSKLDSQLMSPAEKRAYVEEQGLNSNLTKAEQLQMRVLSKVHRDAVAVQQAKIREDNRRFGDAATIQNLIRVLRNADSREKEVLKQALMDAGDNLHE